MSNSAFSNAAIGAEAVDLEGFGEAGPRAKRAYAEGSLDDGSGPRCGLLGGRLGSLSDFRDGVVAEFGQRYIGSIEEILSGRTLFRGLRDGGPGTRRVGGRGCCCGGRAVGRRIGGRRGTD